MMRPLILVLEDDEAICLSLRSYFESKQYEVMTAATGNDGLRIALKEVPDTVILDLRLPDIYGIDVMKRIKETHPQVSVVVMTGHGEVGEAVTAMKSGAEYYFQKPLDLDELGVIVEKSLGIRRIRQQAELPKGTPHPIVGRSDQTQGLIHMISLLAANPATTVLIRGETGTGKELVARNIHAMSPRSGKAFMDINCASLPEQMVESELFGYESGAFTDAKKTKAGLCELADGGSLFLDEIGDMPLGAQAKVLKVIENKMLRRLGGTRDIAIDVRVIAATNKDLEALVRQGSFREDLYYRLNVMPLMIAPLRDRREDIPMIADFLLSEVKKTIARKDVSGFTEAAVGVLCAYSWPGNVRELRNVVERAAILCPGGDIPESLVMVPKTYGRAEKPMTLREVELNEKLKQYGLR
jgi:two-component system response regulator AtoC